MENKMFKIFNNIYGVLFIALISQTIVSCDTLDSSVLKKPVIELSTDPNQAYPIVSSQVRYNKMTASANVQDLVFNDTNTDVSLSSLKDSVILYVEGGPKHLVQLEGFKGFKEAVLTGLGGALIPNGFPNHSFIGMHQMHEVNPTVFGSGLAFTPQNAEEVNNQTLDMIERVVSWLKSNKKVVFLFGHSNGSLMVQNYMASGRTAPSYYIITGTRLKVIQDMLNNYPNNVDISYTNGTILNTTKIADVAKPYFNVLRYLQMNHNKNYITLLAGNTMLSKTFYSLGFKDEALGKIDSDEQAFINTNCPHIYFPNVYIPNSGGHGDASIGIVFALQTFRKK